MISMEPCFKRLFFGIFKWAGIILLIITGLYFGSLNYSQEYLYSIKYFTFILLAWFLLFILSTFLAWWIFCPQIRYDIHKIDLLFIFNNHKSFLWTDIILYENGYRGFILEFSTDKKLCFSNPSFQIIRIAYDQKDFGSFIDFLRSNFNNEYIPKEYTDY